MTTLREILSVFGKGGENIRDEYRLLDTEVEPLNWCLTEDGRTFVLCGGEALAAFRPAGSTGRNRIYLVYNDDEGKAWEVEQRKAAPGAFPNGSRPSARLEIVLSA